VWHRISVGVNIQFRRQCCRRYGWRGGQPSGKAGYLTRRGVNTGGDDRCRCCRCWQRDRVR